MDKELYLSKLYDYYNPLLTDHQKICFEEYFFENLTQEEIANNLNISKNAISKTLKETEIKLLHYEDALHLLKNKEKIEKIVDEETLKKIINYI